MCVCVVVGVDVYVWRWVRVVSGDEGASWWAFGGGGWESVGVIYQDAAEMLCWGSQLITSFWKPVSCLVLYL